MRNKKRQNTSENSGHGGADHYTLKGSFTVETALLMGIILPVLAALIITAYYVHDRGVLQAAVCESALAGEDLYLYDDRQSASQQVLQQEAENLVWGSAGALSVQAGEGNTAASGNASFPLPGIVKELLGDQAGNIEVSWNQEILESAKLIRKVRGIKQTIDIALEQG